jgi:hypothetical protein
LVPGGGAVASAIQCRDWHGSHVPGYQPRRGLVGNEGMVGLPVFVGAGSSPSRPFAQVGGSGRRIPAAAFLEHASDGGSLGVVLQR